MRKITAHKLNGLNDAIEITATDHPGAGGAHHQYRIAFPSSVGIPNAASQFVHFQQGPIAENGVNGISNEALLAIVIDRLQGFQSGEFKCRENAIALTKLEEAMHWLKHRTRERLARGVEGTSAK
jgi:hypothetical protein